MKVAAEVNTPPPSIEKSPDFGVRTSLKDKLNLADGFLPTLLALPLGLLAYATVGISWLDIALFFGMFVFAQLGITAGYHRYFTHQSFKTNRIIESLLGIAGAIGSGTPLIWWVALHRRHHQYAEQAQDPHSPFTMGSGILGRLKGFAHAHITWFLSNEYLGMKGLYYIAKYAPDLRNNPRVLFIVRHHNLIVLLGLLVPACIGVLVGGTVTAALTGLLWGGVIRQAACQNTEFCVNSLGHMFGGRSYETKDNSRNNMFVALISGGEGWHNNHHAFPYSARHGLLWWQIDMCYLFLVFLKKCSLIWDVKQPERST